MDFKLYTNVPDTLLDEMNSHMRAYNYANNHAAFVARDLPENNAQPLNIVASDDAGKVIGGLLAETQLAWLKISILVVVETMRRQGVGRRLVELAEQEARSRNCKYVFLDTMCYQAPDFYRGLGYQLVGAIEDWDSYGHTKYFFKKQIS